MSFLRGENIICGTSTTGTGTLTLAATPGPPGGADFDVLARATGNGFANSAAILVSYTLIEYTDSTFATAKQQEKGIGTLTLGGSSGIANCTLARTTVQQTATSENAQPASYNISGPSAITIGTAANVLIFIGASAADIPAFSPYFESALGDTLGVASPSVLGSAGATGANLASGTDLYIPFLWLTPMLVKACNMRVVTGYSGGTPVSNADARLYAIGSNGRPGKLLLDFGLLGSAGTSLNNSTTNIKATAAGAFLLLPGIYVFNFLPVFSGGVTLPQMLVPLNGGGFFPGTMGTTTLANNTRATATGGAIGAAPDPANVVGYAVAVSAQTPLFTLNTS